MNQSSLPIKCPKVRCDCGIEISKKQMPAHLASRRHSEKMNPERVKCVCGCTYKNTEQYQKHLRTEKHAIIMSHGSVAAHTKLINLRQLVRYWQDEINDAEPGTDWWRTANYNLEMVREELNTKFSEYV